MKKLLAFVFLTVTLALAADNYQISFNACLSDGKLQAADSILDEWSRATPTDPELFPARFNLLLNRATSDATRRDSLVDCAFAEIDRGISAYPDRIDFRLCKSEAASVEGRWSAVIEAVEGMLDHDVENGGHWLGMGNTSLTNAATLLADAVFERLGDIYSSDSRTVVNSALSTADKAAKRFGNDVRILNMAGNLNFGVANNDAALRYFEEAALIAPDDAIPLTNIGYIKYQQGDSVKALEIFRKIETGDYDEESRNIARQMIAQITTPVQNMPEYFYFFRYMPQIAEQVTSAASLLDIKMINSQIPASNKLRSPFADTDIKVDDITQLEGEPKVVVWTFPMPKKIPMCRYIAFVADGKGKHKILTLEKSLENYWIVGTMKGTEHSNFGDVPYPDDAAAFVEALRKKKLLK